MLGYIYRVAEGMVEGDQSPQCVEVIIYPDFRESEVWEGFQEEVSPKLRVLRDTCRVMRLRD